MAAALCAISSGGAAAAGIEVKQDAEQVQVTWPLSPVEQGQAVFDLGPAKPLIASLESARTGEVRPVLRGLNPVFLLTIGERDLTNPVGWVAFFDNPPLRPHRTFLATLGKRTVAVTGGEARMTLSLAEITAGSFHGDVRFTFYRNSPLVRVEAAVTTEEQGRAIFTSTGEVLAPKFRVGGKESGETLEVPQTGESVVEADVEWTFPLNDAEVISGDGKQVFRQRIDPSDTEGFGSRHLRVPVPLQGRTWVRFEVWDVAAEGAYTQSPARSRTKFRRGGTRKDAERTQREVCAGGLI